ncbi:2-dehydro-3-deoxygalactonokinase [Aeromonas jandaei]
MTEIMLTPGWVAVDWGTSNFRAFLMTEEGHVIDKLTASCGLLAVPNGQFPQTFQQLTSPWAGTIESLPILFGGMVGSQQGWCDVPYVSLPVSIQALSMNLLDITLPWGHKGWIVPGATGCNPLNLPDVMRGEEIQLMGLASRINSSNATTILPGTHSKHASLENGALMSFQTFMTGELFSVLKHHSILGRQLPEQTHCKESYLFGVNVGLGGALSSVLFSARTTRLFNHVAPVHMESYLSGLLVGAELTAINIQDSIYIVGDEILSELYQIALQHIGVSAEIVSGDACFLAGMTSIYKQSEEKRNVA